MSIHCHEDRTKLFVAEIAYCATTEEADRYSAICKAHFDAIPAEARFPFPIIGGLDVHDLYAGPNGYTENPFEDILSFGTMEFGDYRFSVSREAAGLLLPRCTELYLANVPA